MITTAVLERTGQLRIPAGNNNLMRRVAPEAIQRLEQSLLRPELLIDTKLPASLILGKAVGRTQRLQRQHCCILSAL